MKFSIIIFLVLNSFTLTAQTNNLKKRYFKEFAFCQCVSKIFENDSTFLKDASRSFYSEMLNYDVENTEKLNSLITKYILENTLKSKYQDYKGRKFLMRTCINFYESKILKDFLNKISFFSTR